MASSVEQASPPQARNELDTALNAGSQSSSSPSSSSSPPPPPPRKQLTRSQLARRIAKGETLVLRGRTIYKLDSWLKRHPGGELAILHFVGRDASDEIEVYHSQATLDRMRVFAVATLAEDDWLGPKRKSDGMRTGYRPLIPPIQLGYRNGRLDHPDAHEDLWRRKRRNDHSDGDAERSRSLSPSTASDSGYESAGPSWDKDAERPQTFPLPLSLLEPPPDPDGMDPAKEREISIAFKQLHEEVKASGLYTLRPAGYMRECSRYLGLALTSYLFWHYANGRTSFFLASSFFLGLFWHQLTFTAHDAGHSGITHNHTLDRLIGSIIADLVGGLSLGWWCDNHDVHHLVTNHPDHDPDIQHMPFFAISPRFVKENEDGPATLGLWSSYYRRVLTFDAPARLFLKAQHHLYYVVMSLGRFNLYANSYGFLTLKAKRDRWFYVETIFLAIFWSWYGALLASCPTWGVTIGYLLISHIVTSPLHVQIVLSHFAQSSHDMGLSESFASRQVRTTMDVQCAPYLDFLHGGLHMQVSHHLFPRLPRHNLRECRDRFVKPFADKWGLGYQEYTFTKGNGRVLKVLKDVADQVRVLGEVAGAQARGEIEH